MCFDHLSNAPGQFFKEFMETRICVTCTCTYLGLKGQLLSNRACTFTSAAHHPTLQFHFFSVICESFMQLGFRKESNSLLLFI